MPDIRTAKPTLAVELELNTDRSMQAQAVDPSTRDLYVTRELGTDAPTDTVVYHCDRNGKRISRMICKGAGHGSGIAFLEVGGLRQVAINWAGSLLWVPYQAGQTVTRAGLPAAFPKVAKGHCYAHINPYDQSVCIRTKAGGKQSFALYRLVDGDAGAQIGKTVAGLSDGTATLPHQGFFVAGDQLFLPQGYGGRSQRRVVDVWSFTTGEKLYTVNNPWPGSYPHQEPEGGLVIDGKVHLGFSSTTAAKATHHLLYRYEPAPAKPAKPKPAGITADMIATAGKYLSNVDAAAEAARKAKLPFWLMCAVLDKESKGRNVYGHDRGGALSGYGGEVNEANWRVFWWLVSSGQTSNGVGPMQLTYKGFFTDMLAQNLKPWDVADNMLYGARLLRQYLTDAPRTLTTEQRIKAVGKRYNGAAAYGDDLWKVAQTWYERLGNADNPSFKP
jgi:hypothetical protein